MTIPESAHVAGRYETTSGYVADLTNDRSVVLWCEETGDAIEIPHADMRGVLFVLAAAYVNGGRFKNDAERKAFAAAQS